MEKAFDFLSDSDQRILNNNNHNEEQVRNEEMSSQPTQQQQNTFVSECSEVNPPQVPLIRKGLSRNKPTQEELMRLWSYSFPSIREAVDPCQ